MTWRHLTGCIASRPEELHLVIELEIGNDVCEAVVDIAHILKDGVATLIAIDEDGIAMRHV